MKGAPWEQIHSKSRTITNTAAYVASAVTLHRDLLIISVAQGTRYSFPLLKRWLKLLNVHQFENLNPKVDWISYSSWTNIFSGIFYNTEYFSNKVEYLNFIWKKFEIPFLNFQ